MEQILAGFMIAFGASLYLKIGGALGAFLFSIGLLTILYFKLKLFTGKAGLLATKQINPFELLVLIWFGNLLGCAIFALIAFAAGLGPTIAEPASAIILTRISNTWYQNIFLGVLCGILMYIAVNQYEKAPYATIMCVASFILLGANHCVADMAYMFFGATKDTILPMLWALICTTIGNVIGCNIIPYVRKKTS